MDWVRSTGTYGTIVVVVTVALVAVGAVAAHARVPRRVAVSLMVAGILPGCVGMAGLFASTFRPHAALRSPTPQEVAAGIEAGQRCLLLGMTGSALVLVAAALAYVRSPRPEEPPPV